MSYDKLFKMDMKSIYDLYIQKVQRKERLISDVDIIIEWLTGYTKNDLNALFNQGINVRDFFMHAPSLNPKRHLIKGVICGVRVEDIEDPLIQLIRYLDKLIDELAKGKKITSILKT